MNEVTLLRHGQTSFHLDGRYQGDTNESILTEAGRKQAIALGACLSPLAISKMYSSPLVRSHETATLLVKAGVSATLSVDQRLREVSISQWRGLAKSSIRASMPNAHLLWRCLPGSFYDDSGLKPLHELYARIRTFISDNLEHSGSDSSLIVGHDHVNRALIASLLDLPLDTHALIPQSLGAVSRLVSCSSDEQRYALATSNWEHCAGVAAPLQRTDDPRIILIRHGVTDANVRRVYQGSDDLPLNDLGRQQAEALELILSDLNPKIVISSALSRAQETAKLLPFPRSCLRQQDERLNEFVYGRWQGISHDEVSCKFASDLNHWRLLNSDLPIPDGERLSSLLGRVASVYSDCVDLANRLGTVIVVAHDVVIRAFICLSLRIGLKSIWKFEMSNCGVTELGFNALRWTELRRHNITSGPYTKYGKEHL